MSDLLKSKYRIVTHSVFYKRLRGDINMIEVECGCGHKTLITNKQWKTGSVPDLCYECYKKKKNEKRKKDSIEFRNKQIEKGYPILTGTEKQILWGYKLRNLWISCYEDEVIGKLLKDYKDDPSFIIFKKKFDEILAKKESKFYIDNSHLETL